jgi:hypothetical protein
VNGIFCFENGPDEMLSNLVLCCRFVMGLRLCDGMKIRRDFVLKYFSDPASFASQTRCANDHEGAWEEQAIVCGFIHVREEVTGEESRWRN